MYMQMEIICFWGARSLRSLAHMLHVHDFFCVGTLGGLDPPPPIPKSWLRYWVSLRTCYFVHTRVGWKVHRLTMIQWSNLTKCGLFFNIVSPAVHALLPSVLQRLDSRGIEALILILEEEKQILNCRYDLIIGPILLPSQVFFHVAWGTEDSQMVPNQENVEGDQPVQSHSHAEQPLQPQTCVQEHCPGETGLPSSVFQAVHEMSL